MLDTTTKRKIDTARQVLVGKVPDPKAQVDQITTALIYKFMDDMDKESQEIGGKAKFFTNGFEKYSWTKLMDKRLSGSERLDLYIQAVTNLSKNPHIPQLFRDIFKDAFLPYRDAETLSLFLKEIDSFTYDHSEDLGNAFEYLLSVLGSQGDAGQFRTPRHIIDFIVEVVDPKKHETILDPACGTAGFLISAYKYIRKHNSSNFNEEDEDVKDKIEKSDAATETVLQEKVAYSGDLLTPAQKKKLMNNFTGYDISPDMVKLSLVNMYLHGFTNPQIQEYDTLTSEKHWGEQVDVIMANPPFMTPKGGIRPHKRFSIKSKRAEVLFVDYLLEHLTANGRGAIIVPDGIINNKTNTTLREKMLDQGLFAVVSLHQYVFKPYAGAKTSICFFDKSIKNTGKVLFIDIRNDGYQKNVLRKKIEEDDLPQALELLEAFRNNDREKLSLKGYDIPAKVVDIQKLDGKIYGHYVKKLELFPNTYIYENSAAKNKKSAVKIGAIFNIKKGTLQSTKAESGPYRFVTASSDFHTHETYSHDGEALVIAVAAGGSLGKIQYVNEKFVASDLTFVLTPKNKSKIDMIFYLYYFKSIQHDLVRSLAKGVGKPSINKTDFSNFFVDSFGKEFQKKVGIEIRDGLASIAEKEHEIAELNYQMIRLLDEEVDRTRTEEDGGSSTKSQGGSRSSTVRIFPIQQAIGVILDRGFERGEMVLDKVLYVAQEIYGVPLSIPFVPHKFGPWSVEVKKAIMGGLGSRSNFFKKKTTRGGVVIALDTNSSKLLNYSNARVVKEMQQALDNFLPNIKNLKSSDIECLVTVCKIIQDNQTTDYEVVLKGMREWKKNKFTSEQVQWAINFLQHFDWDKKLINK